MAYIFVFISLVFLWIKGYCGKKIGTQMASKGDSLLFTLIRMLFCILIGFFPIAFGGELSALAIDAPMFWISLLAGVSTAALLVGWIMSVQYNTMVMVDVVNTMATIFPAILCAIFFSEAILPQKMIGFLVILVAAWILAGGSKADKKKLTLIGCVFLALSSFGEGVYSFTQQLYKHYCTEEGMYFTGNAYSKVIYLFYSYLFAAAFLLLVFIGYVIFRKTTATPDGPTYRPFVAVPKALPYIAVMAACLFAASYLQTAATGDYGMPSQVMYPLIKGGCLATVNLTGLCFGERITKRTVAGTIVSVIGILIMSVSF